MTTKNGLYYKNDLAWKNAPGKFYNLILLWYSD